jgi:hypothetical protein
MAMSANRLISILGVMIALAGAALWMGRDQLLQKQDDDAAASEFSRLAEPSGDRQAVVAGLFQGALLNSADGTDFGAGPAYVRLLQHVQAMPAADFSSRVTGRLNWEDALAHPAQWRGEFVRVRGLCAQIDAVKVRGGEGLEDVYRGFIGQPDGNSEIVAFDSVVPPVEIAPNKDVLDVEGVFFRTVRYESKTGATREVPYLIVRNLSVYQPPVVHLSTSRLLLRIGLVAAAAVATAALMLYFSSRRRPPIPRVGSPGIREMFEKRVRDDQLHAKPPKTE